MELPKVCLDDNIYPPEPRWPAMVALLAVGGLHASMPPVIAVGPRWLVPALVVVLLVPAIWAHWRCHHAFNHTLGIAVNGVVTAAMIVSLYLLVRALPIKREKPEELLLSASLLWLTNIIVFASWYWRLDAGGPHKRDARPGHPEGAFLFPQMALDDDDKASCDLVDWSPGFMDYLFLAFNTSTAFSPTDVSPLSRWAKALMMVQSLISLSIIVLLAARAVNILGT